MQSSAARAYENYGYDLEKYEQRPEREATPRLTVRTGKKAAPGVSPLRLLCCGFLLVMLISVAIYNNIAMVELGDQLNHAKAQLEELNSQAVALQSKMESTNSSQNVEAYASSVLGMGHVEKYQITYVSVNGKGGITRTNKAPDKTPAQVLLRGFDNLLEYMKLK